MQRILDETMIEHVTTFSTVDDVLEYLKLYSSAGFVCGDQYAEYPFGVQTGRINLGSEYLELCCVTDEDAFASAPAIQRWVREDARPYAIGLVTPDLKALREYWLSRGVELPELDRLGKRGLTVPKWSQRIPRSLIDGVGLFVLERPASRKKAPPSPNGVEAFAGVTFVCENPDERSTAWSKLFERSSAAGEMRLGPHSLRWITARTYAERYGRAWEPASHPLGEVAVVHLETVSLDTTAEALEALGRTLSRTKDGILVHPDLRDGFTYEIVRS